jgi:hypothetical protein
VEALRTIYRYWTALLFLAVLVQIGAAGYGAFNAAPVLVAIQIVLAWAGEDHPVVGIFHPLVALLIAGLTGSLAFAAWRRVRAIG